MAQSFLVRAILIRTFFVFFLLFFSVSFFILKITASCWTYYIAFYLFQQFWAWFYKKMHSAFYTLPTKNTPLDKTLKFKWCFYYYLSVCLDDHISDILAKGRDHLTVKGGAVIVYFLFCFVFNIFWFPIKEKNIFLVSISWW